MPRRPPVPLLELADAERRMLAFAAELRFVLAAQVAAALELPEGEVVNRLQALTDAGYVSRDEPLHAEPAHYRVERPGLVAIESELRAPTRDLDLSSYRHEAGVAWLHVAARRGTFGVLREVVSERRMRSSDGRSDHEPELGSPEPFGVRLGPGYRGREQRHYPDLVMVTGSGRRIAFELELTTKSKAKRERILSAYAISRRVDAVVYLIDDPRRRAAYEASVRRLGIGHRVRVEPVAVGHRLTGPPDARAPGRRADRSDAAERHASR